METVDREIDYAIAREIFGFELEMAKFAYHTIMPGPDDQPECNVPAKRNHLYKGGREAEFFAVPNYSSRVDVALQVVEKMNTGIAGGRQFSFGLFTACSVSSVMFGYEAWFNTSVYPPKRGEGWGSRHESMARAICVAALVAARGGFEEGKRYGAAADDNEPEEEIRGPGGDDAPDDGEVCSVEDWHFYQSPGGDEPPPDLEERYDELPDAPEEEDLRG